MMRADLLRGAIGTYLLFGGTVATAQSKDDVSLRQIVEEQRTALAAQSKTLRAQQAAIDELRKQVAVLQPSAAGSVTPIAASVSEVPRAPSGSNQSKATGSTGSNWSDTARPNPPASQPAAFDPSTGPRLRVGGRIQFDVLAAPNAAPGEQEDLFIPRLINTSASAPRRDRTRLIGRDTRVWAEGRWPTSFGGIKAFGEIDFFGALGPNDQTSLNVSSLRLRHAYIEAGPGRGRWLLTLGQSWSAFNDAEAYGSFFNALPFGSVFVRQGQARLTAWINPELSASVSVENPEAEIARATGDDFDVLPDLVLNVRSERSWGNLQAGLVLRRITELQPRTASTGWGVNLGGALALGSGTVPPDRIRFQVNYGNGIGRYIGELAGGFDGVLDENWQTHLNTIYAGNVSVEHRWSDQILTNVGISRVHVRYGQDPLPSALQETYSITANLDFKPTPATDLVAEYILGRRDDFDGSSAYRSFVRLSARLTY